MHVSEFFFSGRRQSSTVLISHSEYLLNACMEPLYALLNPSKFPHTPSPRGEGRGGVTKDSMSVSEFLLSAGAGAIRNTPRAMNHLYRSLRRTIFPPPSGGNQSYGNMNPLPCGRGQGVGV